MDTRKDLLARFNASAAQLLEFSKSVTDPEILVYEDWTVKQTLGHITFWHESFARNIHDLVNDIKPKPVAGAYAELNRRCFEELKTQTFEDVLNRFITAHSVVNDCVLSEKLVLIPYRVGSRSYSPEEHLEIVSKHILTHLKALKAAVRRSAK